WIGGLDLEKLLRRAVDGGKSRRFRLDHEADLLDIKCEALEVDRRAIPAEHIAIEQVPGSARFDARADLRARVYQSLGRQHLHRLAHRSAADLVDLAAFRLIGEKRARSIIAPDDALAEVMRHFVIETFAK